MGAMMFNDTGIVMLRKKLAVNYPGLINKIEIVEVNWVDQLLVGLLSGEFDVVVASEFVLEYLSEKQRRELTVLPASYDIPCWITLASPRADPELIRRYQKVYSKGFDNLIEESLAVSVRVASEQDYKKLLPLFSVARPDVACG